jgi:hypothetical protein
MKPVNGIAGLKKFAALCALVFVASQQAQAAPVRLACSFEPGAGVASNTRTFTYDLEAHMVDGHHVGDKVPTVGSAYNQYFITDTLVGFSTSSGVRHTISLADGRYTAYGANGSVHWSGTCSVAK